MTLIVVTIVGAMIVGLLAGGSFRNFPSRLALVGLKPSQGPMSDSVKECTELKTPLRVMKVPRMVRRKLPRDRLSVHSFRVCRRSWTIAEWRKAVAVSQGRKEAFSTGSHAQ